MVNVLLERYVQQRINQPTVILSFRILLHNHYLNGMTATMTKTEIEREFNRVHEQYGIATFRRDYVLRQCGKDENAIDQSNDQFFIKKSFMDGMNQADFQIVIDDIDRHWGDITAQQEALISEIEGLLEENDNAEQRTFVRDLLSDREVIKRGQAFEVASFAVLNTFSYALGFELRRFSTTYSNDGGIDFVAENTIYQVTTKLSERKFEEDIKKVPGKMRVLVYRDMVRDFNTENFKHHLVANHIGKEELFSILDYLITKNATLYMPRLLKTMITEFRREFYQNDAT